MVRCLCVVPLALIQLRSLSIRLPMKLITCLDIGTHCSFLTPLLEKDFGSAFPICLKTFRLDLTPYLMDYIFFARTTHLPCIALHQIFALLFASSLVLLHQKSNSFRMVLLRPQVV